MKQKDNSKLPAKCSKAALSPDRRDAGEYSCFPYDSIPEELVEDLRVVAARIRMRVERTAAEIVEIGRDLIWVHDCFGTEKFEEFVVKEFGMSRSSAYRMMAVAKRFPNPNVGIFPSALFELASGDTPDEVVEYVERRAADGEHVSVREIQRLKKEAIALRSEVAELRDDKAELADKVVELTDILAMKKVPSEIVVRPDVDALRRQYEGFAAHWQTLPMELRERFFTEHKTPFSATNGGDLSAVLSRGDDSASR